MPRSQFAHRGSILPAFHPLLNQIADHLNKTISDSSGSGTVHANPSFFAHLGCFFIKIKHDLHVIADKSNGNDNHTVKLLFVVACLD